MTLYERAKKLVEVEMEQRKEALIQAKMLELKRFDEFEANGTGCWSAGLDEGAKNTGDYEKCDITGSW